jgi:hypothetical protein
MENPITFNYSVPVLAFGCSNLASLRAAFILSRLRIVIKSGKEILFQLSANHMRPAQRKIG